MKERFYGLVFCSVIWFVFGTMLINRSNTDFVDLARLEGRVEAIGVTQSHGPKRTVDVLYFKIEGLQQTLGIYHNTLQDYQRYLTEIQVGDRVKVWYDKAGPATQEGINLHVFQVEKGQETLLEKEKRNKTDRRVGLILYGIGILFAFPAIWFYQKKVKKGRPTPNTTYANHRAAPPQG
jgi:hypothetical protein